MSVLAAAFGGTGSALTLGSGVDVKDGVVRIDS